MTRSLNITGAPSVKHTVLDARPLGGASFFFSTLYIRGVGREEKFDRDPERYARLARMRTDTSVAEA